MNEVPTPTTDPQKPPMTQEQCEHYIMLQGQKDTPVFEIHLVDKEVDEDPTMRALLEAVTQMIHKGIMGMPFTEANRPNAPKPNVEIIK